MNKEVNDALHTLLSMALENKKYTTQKEQFDIVHKEIERLQDKILKLETDASIYKDLSNLRQDRINKANNFIDQEIMYIVKPKDYNKIEMLQDILNDNKFRSDKE